MQTHVPNKAFVWQSKGARYVRAMCLFLIPDIPNKHVDIPNIYILMLGNQLGRICGQH